MTRDYFDLVPVIKETHSWKMDLNKNVIIHVNKQGILHRIAANVFRRPKEQVVELDGYGSLVWQKINGKRTVGDIVEELMGELGEEATLARRRAALFMEMLRIHGLIRFAGQ